MVYACSVVEMISYPMVVCYLCENMTGMSILITTS